MPSGRKTPALFELIKPGQPGAGMPPPRPIPVSRPVETQGSAPAAEAGEPTSAVPPPPPMPPPSITARVGGRIDLERRLTLPMSAIYLAGAGLLVVVLVIWAIAYNVGQGQERAKAERQMNLIAPQGIRDPLRDGPVASPGANAAGPTLKTTAGKASPSGMTSGSGQTPATGAAPSAQAVGRSQNPDGPSVRTSTGVEFGVDPRQAGLNYLLVEGRLDRASAERIFNFLRASGVPAFAIVDDRGGAVNNPPLYLVGVDRGVTAEDFRARAQSRTDVESMIRRLGKVYQTEHRGNTDFSRTSWERKR